MEHSESFKRIVVWLLVLFFINLGFLVAVVPNRTTFFLILIAIQAIVGIYFAVISFGLLKQAGKAEKKPTDNRTPKHT